MTCACIAVFKFFELPVAVHIWTFHTDRCYCLVCILSCFSIVYSIELTRYSWADPEGGGGNRGSGPPPPEKHKNIAFLGNSGPNLLKNQCWAIIDPPAKCHLNGVLLAGRWWPTFSGNWSSLSHNLKGEKTLSELDPPLAKFSGFALGICFILYLTIYISIKFHFVSYVMLIDVKLYHW